MELIDPFDGLGDLAAGRLRTPLDPEISFGGRPAAHAARRPLRGPLLPRARPRARRRRWRRMHGRLSIVSAERIRDELDKIVMVDVPSVALWFVVRTGLAGEFLPELPGLALEQDPIHRHKDVLAHTLAVVDKTSPDRLLRLAALFHDVGKPRTRAITDGGVSFHHHEVVGARMTRTRMEALRYSARRRGHRGAPGRAAPALPHLPAGLDRQGGAALRARRRPASRPAERADPLRLHDAQRGQGQGAGPAHGRAGGPHRRAARAGGAARRCAPTSTGTRSWSCWASGRAAPWGRRWTSSWSSASTRAPWARRRRRPGCGPGGRAQQAGRGRRRR